MNIYTVTAVWQGAEVGFGEGESLEWAMAECRDDCPPFLAHRMDEVEFIVAE